MKILREKLILPFLAAWATLWILGGMILLLYVGYVWFPSLAVRQILGSVFAVTFWVSTVFMVRWLLSWSKKDTKCG